MCQQQQHHSCNKSTYHSCRSARKFNCILLLLLAAILYITNINTSIAARTRLRNVLDVRFNYACPTDIKKCNSNDENEPAVNLFQVTSSNPESPDKTNFILSNIGGPPMVIMTSSLHDSKLLVNWKAILETEDYNGSDAFHFNETQNAVIGLLLENIIIFDDKNQTGQFTPESDNFTIDWARVNWDLASRTTYLKDDFLKITLRMRPDHPYNDTIGNIQIRLAIPRDIKADRQTEVPHLKLGTQSLSVVVIVDNLQPPRAFTNPRLYITFAVVIQSSSPITVDTDSEPLISDEYTPGIFKIKSLQFKSKQPPSKTSQDETALLKPANENLGFFYWKEVAYTDRRKIISRTIDVFDTTTDYKTLSKLPNISIPFYQFFTHKSNDDSSAQYYLYRISYMYGKGNTLYSTTNFTDFSFVFGLGTAPREQMFSFLVKIIIFVCFCLPILITIAGVAHLMLRRFRRYGDTELLLAAESQ